MKKILVLLLALLLVCSLLASCEYLPDAVKDALNLNQETPDVGDELPPEDTPHEHEFVLSDESKKATCSRDGKNVYVCSCGERTEEVVAAFGHDFKITSVTDPSCTVAGGTKMKCNTCGTSTTEKTPATGHNFAEFEEYSRLIPCLNDKCSYAKLPEGDGKYKEQLVYKFQESDLDRFDEALAEIGALVEAAELYDPALHAYVEGSALEEEYLVLEGKYEELYELVEYVTAQYQLAQVEYHVGMKDEKKEVLDYISEVRTDLIVKFYSYSQAIYDSKYRDYYYYGMTEEEIRTFIFESDAISNPEYKALVDRNKEIELEFTGISDPTTSDLVPVLYAEFVANNKRIAEMLGYDNYLEYAYENIYDRDYSYTEVKTITEYAKTYLSSVYTGIYNKWNTVTSGYTDAQYMMYKTYILDSFFTSYDSNKHVNDYIDIMNITSASGRVVTFSDEFNGLMSNGNLFRGQYNAAYVTKIYGANIPIAYFGLTNSSAFTIVHELGHYMNEIYNTEDYSQSYDILEMHSQGDEMLFLAYLMNCDDIKRADLAIAETYQLLVTLDTVMNALAVDTFEQAVYTDTYNGAYSAQIMADGLITADEYDLLYESILVDLGTKEYNTTTYWRYMTITSPCYYVSYSVSAVSVLQLYAMAQNDFDAAKESYLKLFTYVDELNEDNDYMATDDILEYAGLYSFTDEELYIYLARALKV